MSSAWGGFQGHSGIIHVGLLPHRDRDRVGPRSAEDAWPSNRDGGLQPPGRQLHVEELEESIEGQGEDGVCGGVAGADPQRRQDAPAAPPHHEPRPPVPVRQSGAPACWDFVPGQGGAAEDNLLMQGLARRWG